MIYVLTSIILIGAAVLGITALVNWGRTRVNGEIKRLKAALDTEHKARVESDRALDKAERTIRHIANGAGNPVLEAQISLDEITQYHELKEIL